MSSTWFDILAIGIVSQVVIAAILSETKVKALLAILLGSAVPENPFVVRTAENVRKSQVDTTW